MLCIHCGKEIPVGNATCPYCGCAAEGIGASPFKKAGSFDATPESGGAPASAASGKEEERSPVIFSRTHTGSARSEASPGARASAFSSGASTSARAAHGYTAETSGGTFCGQCGARIPPDDRFCPECGAPTHASSAIGINPGPDHAIHGSEKKNRTVGLVAVGVAVVVLAVLAFALFGGRGYKSTVGKFVKASFEGDGEAIVNLMPDEVVEFACEEDDMTRKEAIKELTKSLEKQLDDYDRYFDEWSYSYKITDVEDFTSKELKSLKEDYKDEFDVNVKAAKTVTVEIAIKADKETEGSDSRDIKVIKIGNSWYLDVASMGGLL